MFSAFIIFYNITSERENGSIFQAWTKEGAIFFTISKSWGNLQKNVTHFEIVPWGCNKNWKLQTGLLKWNYNMSKFSISK